MKKVKNIIFGICSSYLLFYIPIAIIAYLPHWYLINCKVHNMCDCLGKSKASFITELTSFLFYNKPLSRGWSVKEKIHLAEVKGILDLLAIIAIICLILFIICFNRKRISKNAVINFFIIGILLLILPFFKFFWLKIFHPLLFNNSLWKNTPGDISYYIMPRAFFKNSIFFLIIFSSLLNGLQWFIFKKK